MEDLIEIYKIRFFKESFNGRMIELMDSTSEVLNQFLTDYNEPALVDKYVVRRIDQVLVGQPVSNTSVSESMVSVRISKETSEFFQDPNYSDNSLPDFVIPTAHFRQIAMLWREFLEDSNRKS